MQGFLLLDIMSKSYKKGMNEMDSVGVVAEGVRNSVSIGV